LALSAVILPGKPDNLFINFRNQTYILQQISASQKLLNGFIPAKLHCPAQYRSMGNLSCKQYRNSIAFCG
jgi:hypothetical protein